MTTRNGIACMTPRRRGVVSDTRLLTLSAFASELQVDALPPDALEAAKSAILYGLAVGVASTEAPLLQTLGDVADGWADGSNATRFLDGRKTGARAAAMANGALLHIRMQEDATAVYSPDIFRKLVQPVDRMIAGHFANSFIHLHSTSMFLLDAFLEIEEIRCFEINIESFNITVKDMIKYFQMVQKADRPLLIRGSFEEEELRILLDSLEYQGLYLNIMVKDMKEVESLRPLLGM